GRAARAGSVRHLADTHFEMIKSFQVRTEYDSVISHLEKAVQLYDSLGMKLRSANAKVTLGGILVEKCQNEAAAKVFIEADEILGANGEENPAQLSSLYINISNNFAAIGGDTESGYYGKKALKMAENAKDTPNIAIALTNLGVYYRYTRPDSALICYQKAAELQRAIKFGPENRLSTLYNLGNIYLDQKNYVKANMLFDSVRVLSEAIPMPKGVVMAISGKATAAADCGQYGESIRLLNRAIEIADSLGYSELQLRFAQAKYYIDLRSGNKEAALQSLNKWMNLKDTMAINTKANEVHAIERKYQIQRRDMEITRLQETQQWQEEQVRDNRTIAVLALIIAMVAILFAYFYARLSKTRWEAYRQLIEKYEESSRRHVQEISRLSYPASKEQDTAARLLVKRIHELFQNEKPYLDPGLKVDSLAEKLGVSYRTLNNALKEVEGSTFVKLINRYRVEAVIQMFRQPEFDIIKTQAIAQQAGFGSVNAFYEAFQEITGVQPSHFRKILAEKTAAGKSEQVQNTDSADIS
ncbi:MAG: helix-turn-helix domain-containing protein, partial [Bacteroidota bacterium]